MSNTPPPYPNIKDFDNTDLATLWAAITGAAGNSTPILTQQTKGLGYYAFGTAGAGVERQAAAPLSKIRVIHSVRVTLTTSAVAGNRRVNIGLRDVTTGHFLSLTASSLTQGPSLSYIYHFSYNPILPTFLTGSGGAASRIVVPLINPERPLAAITDDNNTKIFTIETQTDNLDAGDEFTTFGYLAQEIDYIG